LHLQLRKFPFCTVWTSWIQTWFSFASWIMEA
jgi:hypothetical protein